MRLKLVIIIFLLTSTMFAGNRVIDSLQNEINKARQNGELKEKLGLLVAQQVQEACTFSYTEGLNLAISGLELASSLNDGRNIANMYHLIGKSYTNLGQYEKSISYFYKSIDLFLKEKLIPEAIFTYSDIGNLYFKRGMYEIARLIYQKGIDLGLANASKDKGIKMAIAVCCNNIGLVYTRSNRYDSALKQFVTALNYRKEIGSDYLVPHSLIYIAKTYLFLGDTIRAEQGCIESVQLCEKLLKQYESEIHQSTDLDHSAELIDFWLTANLQLMDLYDFQGKSDKAHQLLLEIKKRIPESNIGLSTKILYSLLDLAKRRKNFPEQLEISNKILELSNKINSLDNRLTALNEISQAYQLLGDYRAALTYHEMFHKCKDSLEDSNYELIHHNFQRAEAIQIAESAIKEIENKRNMELKYRIITMALALILIIGLIIIAVFLYQKYKLNNKYNRELLELSESLRESNKTKDMFFSVIAHDLKSPLGAFKNTAEIVSDQFDYISDEEKKDFLLMIKKSAANIYSLLENLLIWSRTQRGAVKLECSEFDMRYLVENVISLSSLSLEDKSIIIKNKIDSVSIAFGDINLVNTVLRNFVSNAIKFSYQNSTIEIDSCVIEKNSMKYLAVSMKDYGIGLNRQQIEELFVIGTSKMRPGTNNEMGTGLGLIICKEFVSLMGGEIFVESEENKGSTFSFTLPVSDISESEG